MLSLYGCSSRPEETYLLEWKLQVFVYCLIWVLGTELWFSGRPISALNCRIFSPDPVSFLGVGGDTEKFSYLQCKTNFPKYAWVC